MPKKLSEIKWRLKKTDTNKDEDKAGSENLTQNKNKGSDSVDKKETLYSRG